MSHSKQSQSETQPLFDPYSDPVAYLASLGVEAELVEVITRLPEAA
ncbi:MAG TPA: hypothetical protein VLA91_01485 [Acidimicrobiia bacterium]|nr:hypothetical protein [Acidimicrobiia bacterium]